MRQMNVGTILDNACRLAGRDPELLGVPDSWRMLAGFAVNAGLRKIYAEKPPHMKRVEYRHYRPTWSAGAGWTQGQECFFVDRYWRLESGDGTLSPDTEGNGWRKLGMEEVVAVVAFDQPWEPVQMDPAGVDKDAFAYRSDPKYNPLAKPIEGCGWWEEGIVLPSPAPVGVYVKFMPMPPHVSMEEWSGTTGYAAGAVVYSMRAKGCFRAAHEIAAGTEQTPGPEPGTPAGRTDWTAVTVDEAWEEYLTQLAAAALLTEDQGKYQTQAAADRAFDELVERFTQGVGERKVRTGRFGR